MTDLELQTARETEQREIENALREFVALFALDNRYLAGKGNNGEQLVGVPYETAARAYDRAKSALRAVDAAAGPATKTPAK